MNGNRQEYAAAFAKFQQVGLRFKKLLESRGEDIEAHRAVTKSVSLGLYEHWKSRPGDLGFYAVIGAHVDEYARTPSVTYAELTGDCPGMLASRNLLDVEHGFLSPVSEGGYQGPRFRFVTGLTLAEIEKLIVYVGELSIISDSMKFRMHAGKLLKKKDMPLV